MTLHPLKMPKWGLSMEEGRIVDWLVEEGDEVSSGAGVVEVETDKILAAVEVQDSGVLRRRVAGKGDVVPVGGLLAVLTDTETADSEIDGFIEKFRAKVVSPEEDVQAATEETERIQANGRTIQFLSRGRGSDPVILIHGFGGDLNNWLFNHEELAANRKVLAFDLPGHGGSGKDVGNGSLESLAESLEGFMAALEIRSAHLVGHSIGGAVALTRALNEPACAKSLSLICSAALGEEINTNYIEGFIKARRRRDMKTQVERLFGDPTRVTRRMVEDILRFKRMDGVRKALETIAEQLCAGGSQNVVLGKRLDELSLPLLVIWGEKDQIIPAHHAQGLPDNVQTAVVAGAGHMVQMESAARVNRLILGLIDSPA